VRLNAKQVEILQRSSKPTSSPSPYARRSRPGARAQLLDGGVWLIRETRRVGYQAETTEIDAALTIIVFEFAT
jgi:hypothetical protein